jgi:hypothetical protein
LTFAAFWASLELPDLDELSRTQENLLASLDATVAAPTFTPDWYLDMPVAMPYPYPDTLSEVSLNLDFGDDILPTQHPNTPCVVSLHLESDGALDTDENVSATQPPNTPSDGSSLHLDLGEDIPVTQSEPDKLSEEQTSDHEEPIENGDESPHGEVRQAKDKVLGEVMVNDGIGSSTMGLPDGREEAAKEEDNGRLRSVQVAHRKRPRSDGDATQAGEPEKKRLKDDRDENDKEDEDERMVGN